MELAQELITETAVKPARHDLERKIRDRSAQLGVIGLGYVGLPLAVEAVRQVLIRHRFTQLWRPINSSRSSGIIPGNLRVDRDRPEIEEFQKSLDVRRRLS